MLFVKTYLWPSPIAGIGLFAGEPITAGTVTWRFVPGFDQIFTDETIAALAEPARTELLTYTYRHALSGHLVFCLDNARFMNHAIDPNTRGEHPAGAIDGADIATRDIAVGEELTCDYRTFDEDAVRKLGTAAG